MERGAPSVTTPGTSTPQTSSAGRVKEVVCGTPTRVSNRGGGGGGEGALGSLSPPLGFKKIMMYDTCSNFQLKML